MSPIDSREILNRPVPWGRLFFVYLVVQIAAMVVGAPNAQAATGVSASVSAGPYVPDGTLTATGSYTLEASETVTSTTWTLKEGAPATFNTSTSNPTEVTLGSAEEYATHLVEVLKEPPINAADLPPDLVLQPINEIQKGLQDRNQVVGINPMALEHAEEVVLTFTLVTSIGTYTADVAFITGLPWGVSTGVRTVAVGSTVLLYGKDNGSYNWSIISGPSTPTLEGATTQTPWFTPDVAGTFTVEDSMSGAQIVVHAGRYRGVIDPYLTLNSPDGRPVADSNCTGCHMVNGAAPANFDTWRLTGHAEAFTQGITTNSHFGENCFACHAVGFGTNSGIDSTETNYSDFLADLSAAQGGGDISTLWTSILTNQPDTARLSNIQCENCHGPQSYTQAHHTADLDPNQDPADPLMGMPRINLGAETCGSCHGEPARHGRFQQWQLSNHADYDLARSRGASSGNCSRCHSGNGFVAWDELDFDPDQNVAVTWDADSVVPQVCVACHNPHDTGTTSGSDETNARVRVNAATGGTCGGPDCDTYMLAAGFMASNVGKGATCMTCHNSRASVPRNDATWDSLSDSQKVGGPHHGVQADLVMGQNQYFTGGVPIPGAHSLIEDVCVTCHMNATQPPDILSYNQAGTNHTFAADPAICVECHGLAGETLAEQVDNEITGYLEDLKDELGAAWMRLMTANYPVTIDGCGTADVGGNGKKAVNNPITSVEWVYHRGTRLVIEVNGVDCGGEIRPSSILVGKVFNNTSKNTTLEELSLQPGNDDLWKAAWNYGLNYEDETINGCEDLDDQECEPPHTHRGVHNHAFSQQGLLGAINAVQMVSP
jgi:hypothetical protein